MEFNLERFREAPTAEQLSYYNKAQLMSIAEHYCFETASASLKKDELRARVVTVLAKQRVLSSQSEDLDLSHPVKVSTSKTEAVQLQTQDAQSVHLHELELQFKIKQLENEAKKERWRLVHEERNEGTGAEVK